MKENVIKQLNDVDHLLLRPGIYIGSIQPVEATGYFYNESTEKFEYKDFKYIPAFTKIINEILDNACDEASRTNYKICNEIQVTITDNSIKISDNGRGVPVDKDATGKVTQLELAFTAARSGSNFNDGDRILIGQNGVGSFCTCVYSKKFKVTSLTGKQKGVLSCSNNLSTKSCKVTQFASKDTGTTVEFEPDLERFGLTLIDEIHKNLIYQRILFLSITYPEITFKFNKKTVKFRNAKNFISCFSEKFAVTSDDNKPVKYIIGVIPNTADDFNQKSFVNGADCINGGNHIDYIHSEIISRIKAKLEKKYPNIKNGDIKNKLTYVVSFRDFVNAQFDSQTKEKLANNVKDVQEFLKEVDWDKFVASILRVPEIIDPIIETFKIKEELKNRQALAKLGKVSKAFKSEKFLPATKEQKICMICEGNSAAGGLSACLGRSKCGYYSSRGVPLNAYDCGIAKIAENKELEEIVKILNLNMTSDKNNVENMTYDKIVIASDCDSDGSHISGLYVGFFSRFFKSIIQSGKLCRLKTPIMALMKNSEQIYKMFFSLNEYNDYIKNHDCKKYSVQYFKGLGTWTPELFDQVFKSYSLDDLVVPFEYDENAAISIDNWLNSKKADERKEMLRNNEFDIFGI